MITSIAKDGERAWHEGKGFIHNPFNICVDEERFISWSNGWWSIQNTLYESERIETERLHKIEMQKEEEERIIKEKSKTKKGRAELAGQYTLFG